MHQWKESSTSWVQKLTTHQDITGFFSRIEGWRSEAGKCKDKRTAHWLKNQEYNDCHENLPDWDNNDQITLFHSEIDVSNLFESPPLEEENEEFKE
jgi:hypothetical protein